MKNVRGKKAELDLDAALEEIAIKLKPSANMPSCGQTNLFHTKFTASYTCSCCSTCDPTDPAYNPDACY